MLSACSKGKVVDECKWIEWEKNWWENKLVNIWQMKILFIQTIVMMMTNIGNKKEIYLVVHVGIRI